MKHRQVYDSISSTYRSSRREDPRVARHLHTALAGARRVVDVGAGTGNYEPPDRLVVAVEPSAAMLAQRHRHRSTAVQAVAEALPFPDLAFDAAMASFTLHHWLDLAAGLAELRRVAPRQVVFMFDPDEIRRFWAVDYFPEAQALPSEAEAPTPAQVGEVLDVVEVRPVPVPIDCTDGFGAAFWGRPERYLEPDVQQGMSWLALLAPDVRARGVARLEADLRSGEWDARHGHLRRLPELDVGYRLVLAGGGPAT